MGHFWQFFTDNIFLNSRMRQFLKIGDDELDLRWVLKFFHFWAVILYLKFTLFDVEIAINLNVFWAKKTRLGSALQGETGNRLSLVLSRKAVWPKTEPHKFNANCPAVGKIAVNRWIFIFQLIWLAPFRTNQHYPIQY